MFLFYFKKLLNCIVRMVDFFSYKNWIIFFIQKIEHDPS